MVVEDLCRDIPAVSQAPFQCDGRSALPRATAINSSSLSGQTKVSGTSQQQLDPNWDNQHLILLQTGQRKFVITPELNLAMLYECPFAVGHNPYSRCFLDQWIFQLGGVYTAS